MCVPHFILKSYWALIARSCPVFLSRVWLLPPPWCVSPVSNCLPRSLCVSLCVPFLLCFLRPTQRCILREHEPVCHLLSEFACSQELYLCLFVWPLGGLTFIWLILLIKEHTFVILQLNPPKSVPFITTRCRERTLALDALFGWTGVKLIGPRCGWQEKRHRLRN